VAGYVSRDDVVRPISQPLPRNVSLVAADIQFIDHAKREARAARTRATRWLPAERHQRLCEPEGSPRHPMLICIDS